MEELEEEEGLREQEDDLDDLEDQSGGKMESKQILETNADEKEWYSECERVAGKLLINKVTDKNEWRIHLDLLNNNFKKIKLQKSQVKNSIEKLSETVEKKLGKIQSSQNILNNAVCEYFQELKVNNDKKKEAEGRIKLLTGRVKELQDEFNENNTQVEVLQKRIEDQSNSAGNEEEILKMKKSIDELQEELTKIDIRNGVLNNFIMNQESVEKKIKLENVLEGVENAKQFFVEESQLDELI